MPTSDADKRIADLGEVFRLGRQVARRQEEEGRHLTPGEIKDLAQQRAGTTLGSAHLNFKTPHDGVMAIAQTMTHSERVNVAQMQKGRPQKPQEVKRITNS